MGEKWVIWVVRNDFVVFRVFFGEFSVGVLSRIIRGQFAGVDEPVHFMDLYGLFGLCGDAENGRYGLLDLDDWSGVRIKGIKAHLSYLS